MFGPIRIFVHMRLTIKMAAFQRDELRDIAILKEIILGESHYRVDEARLMETLTFLSQRTT